MDPIFAWLRTNNDVFGFGVATLIFLGTILLVSRRIIGFGITLLLLFFALFSGLIIANQEFLKNWMMKDPAEKPIIESQNLEE
jgi:hypothetical protein